MNIHQAASAINTLGEFCGMRDIPTLSSEQLQKRYEFLQADVFVLFGGSILSGGDLLAQAMRSGVAKTYGIVGGEGHTTETLRRIVRALCPAVETLGLPEAEVFARYLWDQYQLRPDFLECASTNCGNNITYLLRLLQERRIPARSIILCQDATMQRRMDAGLRKFAPPEVRIVNYASYQAEICVQDETLTYASAIPGMWDVERYLSLLMGEIPRLTDDTQGYGPKGRDYIAHVQVPQKVQDAFAVLKAEYGTLVRGANPLYASSVAERE